MSLGWAPAFKTTHQEAHFTGHQTAVNWRLDQLTGLASFFVIVFSLLRSDASLAAAPKALALALLCLVPTLWCSLLGVPSYDRHRLWVVSVIRLSMVLVPEVVIALPKFPSSSRALLSTLVLGLRLPRFMVLALGLKLPFFLHLTLQALLLVLPLLDLPTTCSAPAFQVPSSRRLFGTLFGWLSQLGALFDEMYAGRPVGQRPTLDQYLGRQAASPTQCGCIAVLATLMVLLGLLLPSFLVALGESVARREWVAARRRQPGWDECDLHTHLPYDWMLTCVVFGGLLLPVTVLVWHGVMLVLGRSSRLGGVC